VAAIATGLPALPELKSYCVSAVDATYPKTGPAVAAGVNAPEVGSPLAIAGRLALSVHWFATGAVLQPAPVHMGCCTLRLIHIPDVVRSGQGVWNDRVVEPVMPEKQLYPAESRSVALAQASSCTLPRVMSGPVDVNTSLIVSTGMPMNG